MERLLTYGSFNGKIKHVAEVRNGLLCNCICFNCKQPLIAKNNPHNIKQAHFAHSSGSECPGAFETALHELAKQVFLESKCLCLPDFHYDYNPTNPKSKFIDCQKVIFEEVRLEEKVIINDYVIIPDAIAVLKKREIFIEFANTHFVDYDKRKKIKLLAKACVEIDLSKQPLDKSILLDFFEKSNFSKYWIINPKRDLEYSKYLELKNIKIKQKLQEEAEQRERLDEKFDEYKYNSSFKHFKSLEGRVLECPKKGEKLSLLKEKSFYREDLLRRIIDGEYWNCKIYGRNIIGKWIYLRTDKFFIYPPDIELLKMSLPEQKRCDRLFAGLKKIQELLLSDPFLNHCGHCKFAIELLSLENKNIQICSYPKLTNKKFNSIN